jgi:signal transduction histidine kinase
MRNRLVGTYLVLIALVLMGLAVPLAIAVAAGRTEEMVRDRFADAAQFASLAGPALLAEPGLRTGESVTLTDDLRRYHDLYGITAAVADRDGKVVVLAGDESQLTSPAARGRVLQALAGVAVGGEDTIWPWRTDPLAIAAPVRSGGETIGAVITISPTGTVRADILRSWGAVAGGVLAVGAVFVVVALALTRWILRPVAELDDAAHRIGAGEALATPVPAALGPPELRRLTRSFNDMAESVTDVLRRQREFVAQASHQMRNPLTALTLRVESLGEFIHEPAGQTDHRLAMEETDRLVRILDGLLALARAERGHHELEVVDAAVTADERVSAWLPLATKRGITLTCIRPAHAPVLAVPTAVGQSLDALIDNALKFAGRHATVRVEVRANAELVDVHVIDDGPGLSDDSRLRAGERFWRAPEVQNLDGCGLGLPIATVLAEASGGALDLLSRDPSGLDARLRFPAAPAGPLGSSRSEGRGSRTDQLKEEPPAPDQRFASR